ncbi:hypothetical protein [Aquabacterium sp.]|uniref:hypothetical protein n=1 Tax=Aquabacterium sp. TaxID=1872578 RepID=UPI002CD16FA2|nr:hypothetical protein [Aquabacterium sp.]HSW07252.1 hypothetical protein [Aquabacterium sp.]
MNLPKDRGHVVSGTGVSRYEKVIAADGGDGKWHFIDRQNLKSSCGPTCARMVIKLITGLSIGQDYFGGLVALSEKDISPSDSSPMSEEAQGFHDFDAKGARSGHILKALQDNKITNARKIPKTSNWKEEWRKCSEKAPAILLIDWRRRGSHFVVMAGPLSTNPDRFLVLDPAYGVQHIEAAQPDVYKPRHAGAVNGKIFATGSLSKTSTIVTY